MPRFEDLPLEEQESIKEIGRQKKAQMLTAEKAKQVDIGEGIHGLKITLTSDEDKLKQQQQQNIVHPLYSLQLYKLTSKFEQYLNGIQLHCAIFRQEIFIVKVLKIRISRSETKTLVAFSS